MAGYAVSARVGAVAPRRAQRLRSLPDGDAATTRRAPDEAAIDLAGSPLDWEIDERWEEVRERWSQLTFFLFDPDSWRT